MWNPFKKTQPVASSGSDDKKEAIIKKEEKKVDFEPEAPKMGMLGRLAMKRLEKMGPGERAKMMQEAMNPKNRGKLAAAMEAMRKSGQISESQYNEAKKRLGIR